MEDGEESFKIRVAQVGVKRRELRRSQQSFVNHGPTGQRTEISSGGSDSFGFLAEMEKQEFQILEFLIPERRSIAR